MRKRMYRRGPLIKSVTALIRRLVKNEYVWMFGRALHPSFVKSLQLMVLIRAIEYKSVRVAIKI
jgi:hypothetical protein